MTDQPQQVMAEMKLDLAFDSLGEPKVDLGFAGLVVAVGATPDTIEEMGMHMVRTATMARVYSNIARRMMLDGMPAVEVQEFLRSTF